MSEPETAAARALWRQTILAIEADARAEAGHRIPEPHNCFLMNCARLGDEVRRLQVQVTEAAEAARAEVIAELRASVEGLTTQQINWYDAEGRHEEDANVVRLYQVLALLPPTEPK